MLNILVICATSLFYFSQPIVGGGTFSVSDLVAVMPVLNG